MKLKHHILIIMCAAVAAFTLGTSASAQMPTTPGSPDSSSDNQGRANKQNSHSMATSDDTKLKYGDRHFIERVAKMNTEEVDVSRIASQNATNPQVRDFANEMVTAHEKVASALTTLAASKGVTLDNEKENTKKWMDKKANELDEDYVKRMESAHKTMIDLFEKAAKSDDSDVATFANTYLPDLRMHYSKAESIKGQVKKS